MLNKKNVTLDEIYSFENLLKLKHPNNNNVRAKIRQQLQILRDYVFLTFTKILYHENIYVLYARWFYARYK